MHFERLQHKYIFLLQSCHDTVFFLFTVDWINFFLFLCVSKSAKFRVQGVFLPADDVPEQFPCSPVWWRVLNSMEADTQTL